MFAGFDSDYTPVRSTSITTTRTIFINTISDNRLERDERFSIAIDSKILLAGLPPSCYTKVVVTILNDDGKWLCNKLLKVITDGAVIINVLYFAGM